MLFAHLGRVSRPDLIPQFADLCLQVKGIEWSVVSGITGDEMHVSVRNVGYVRAAGDVVQAAFGRPRLGGRPPLGGEGGHPATRLGGPRRAAGGRRDAAGHRHPLRPRARRERRDVLSRAKGILAPRVR